LQKDWQSITAVCMTDVNSQRTLQYDPLRNLNQLLSIPLKST